MKKFISKLSAVLCAAVAFLSSISAAPIDKFLSSFADVTKKYKYCTEIDKMNQTMSWLNDSICQIYFNKDTNTLQKHAAKDIIRYGSLLAKLIMDLRPEIGLDCRHYSYYLSEQLSDLGIKNWLLEKPSSAPGSYDGHIANVYLDPRDNRLYIADGAAQAQGYSGCLLTKELSGQSDILKKFLEKNPTLYAHMTFKEYCEAVCIDMQNTFYTDASDYSEVTYKQFSLKYKDLI